MSSTTVENERTTARNFETTAQPRHTNRIRRNMTPYGRYLTQNSNEIANGRKNQLIQSQINVQDLMAKEIKLRCDKTEL